MTWTALAYGVVWLGTTFYLWRLWRLQQEVERMVRHLSLEEKDHGG